MYCYNQIHSRLQKYGYVDEQLLRKMIENLQFENKLKNSAKISQKKLKKNSTLKELPNNLVL